MTSHEDVPGPPRPADGTGNDRGEIFVGRDTEVATLLAAARRAAPDRSRSAS